MSIINDKDVQIVLEKMSGWILQNGSIKKIYTFDSYMDSIKFINCLANEAEKSNHHPDMNVGWCSIEVAYTSHDKGGVTNACLKMAKKSDIVYLKL